MIVEFSVKNFKSFKEEASLSLLAEKKVSELQAENIVDAGRYRLLKSAVIYGANGSGKSNLFKALMFMLQFIQNSSRETQLGDKIAVDSFKLSTETEGEASSFEIVFLLAGLKYRYGFEVDQGKVQGEWLFMAEKVKEYELFLREGDVIEVSSKFKEARGLESRTRDNALFLSVAAQFNVDLAGKILEAAHSVNIISGLADKSYEAFTVELLEDESLKIKLLAYLNQADFGIVDIHKEMKTNFGQGLSLDQEREAKKASAYSLQTRRDKFDDENAKVGLSKFDFNSEESEGTKKYFRFAGPLIDTLLNGRLLVVDELDARLHPSLTLNIIRMFNSIETNPKGAQLIFSTHDSNILASGLFRRDQICFTEKDQFGATDFYRLSDFKTSQVRKDANYERNYLKGRYGAIPFLGGFDFLAESNRKINVKDESEL